MGDADTKREAQQPQAPDASAFDQWLRLSLCRDHTVVLTEPIPEAMLRILALSDQRVEDGTPGAAGSGEDPGSDMIVQSVTAAARFVLSQFHQTRE
jgi:hypothetical protein